MDIAKYPRKYRIVPKVISFCLSTEFFTELNANLEKVAREFDTDNDDGQPKNAGEFDLRHTDVYNAFVENFERQLEQFIVSEGSTNEKFFKLCQTAQEMGDDNVTSFIELLLACLDFQTFVDLARDAQKRAYFMQIMAGWARQLGGKNYI